MNFLSVYTKDEKILWIKKGKVPLYQGTDGKKILYISSVALQISAADNSKVMPIVSGIAAHLSTTCGEIFNVKIVPPALIHIELTDPTLAAWLDNLTGGVASLEKMGDWGLGRGEEFLNSCLLPPASWERENKNQLLFDIQYTHARCCSLIQLADREGLIKLKKSISDDESFIPAQPIPWLDCEQKLRFHQPDEVRLIHQLVKMVDDLVFPDSSSSVYWETAAVKLSKAFDSFWCNCRIWGEVKTNSPELAQARLGLLIATQLVLRSVLETKLGVFAPLEL
ncbi:anticodon-binding protein [Anabaena sphaerica FACHB-251]|uniref:Anticodon-binding protein n=2 Tax=Anabaena TaxID=1163 RepID=A0A926WLH4_9NOST|nr:DALR anticodon-binding domain-containing protein [Anabaena sphaerica]MBD2296170.1 anticodon-binding protein [Anabaena sphaerica FACHB-251]